MTPDLKIKNLKGKILFGINLSSYFFFASPKLLITSILTAFVLALCEVNLIINSYILFSKANEINQDFIYNKLIPIILSISFIVPLRILYTYMSSKAIARFAKRFIYASTQTSINSWQSTNDSQLTNNKQLMLYEQDILLNDVLPSIWNAILALIIIIYVLQNIAITINPFYVFYSAILIVALGALYLNILYKKTRENSSEASTLKNNISELVEINTESIRSIKGKSKIALYFYDQLSVKTYLIRMKLLTNLLFAMITKNIFEVLPYFTGAILLCSSIFASTLLNETSNVYSPELGSEVFVLYLRLGSYVYLLYTSAYIIMVNLKRTPGFIKLAKLVVQTDRFNRSKSRSSKLRQNHEIKQTNIAINEGIKINANSLNVIYPPNNLKVSVGSFSIIGPALVGVSAPSGSGKSTLFDIIMNNVSASNGQLEIKSTKNNILPSNEIHFMPQKSSLIFSNIISNIFEEEVERSEFSMASISHLSTVMNYFSLFNNTRHDLKEILFSERGKMCNSLSGGEKQIVSIIQCINMKRKVVIADEPTASLDAQTASIVMKLFCKYVFDNNAVIFLASHKEEDLEYCNALLYKRDLSSPFILTNKSKID